jgi:DNA polymerase-1
MMQPSLFERDKDIKIQNSESSFHGSDIDQFAFCLEATGSDALSSLIAGIALCKEKGIAYYVPVRHRVGPNLEKAILILKDYFEDEKIKKIGHDLKYSILLLRQEGINLKGTLYDTMVASYLLNPNKSDHSLETVVLDHLLFKMKTLSEVLAKRHSFADLSIEDATGYSAEKAELTMQLKEILFERLKNEGLEGLYFNIEMPLIYVLADMEYAGIRVNRERLDELSSELKREIDDIESRIYEIAGERFNINSPQQLQKILFEKLGLKPIKRTKTGYSTGVDVLVELSEVHELPKEILNYRTLFKLKTTYVDALPRLINKKTGRIHTSFNQTMTATGRLSSSEPNLQNIPIRGEWGTKIREVFIAEEDHMLISADYSQVELRILAHISRDEGLIDAFRRDLDIHSRTASELFGVSEDKVTPEMRRAAKSINFGIVYGISPYGLSEALGINQKEAAIYIENYFKKHQGVKTYIETIIGEARQKGYVKTLMDRKRPIPEINSPSSNVRQQAERLAINTPIQGTAADLIKIAMINVWKKLKEKGLKTKIILQIHDELLFESPEKELDEAIGLIKKEMEGALSLAVPLKVGIGYGKNWAEAEH